MLIDHVSGNTTVLAPTWPSYYVSAFEDVRSTFKYFSKLVKESALLTAFRWSINWFTTRKGESLMRAFPKIHMPSLSSKQNNSSAAITAVGEKKNFFAIVTSIELYFHRNCLFLAKRQHRGFGFYSTLKNILRFWKSRSPRMFDDTSWKHL